MLRKSKVRDEQAAQYYRKLKSDGKGKSQNQNQNWRKGAGSSATVSQADKTARLPGTCDHFNKGKVCRFKTKCRFSHTCSTCQGNHPQTQCNKKSGSDTTDTKSANSK